jgi:hypothetical protein
LNAEFSEVLNIPLLVLASVVKLLAYDSNNPDVGLLKILGLASYEAQGELFELAYFYHIFAKLLKD